MAMTKVEIDGFARLKPSDGGESGIHLGSRDIEDETVDVAEGDVIVSDGPIVFTIVDE